MSSAAFAREVLVLNADFRPLSTWPISLWSAREGIEAVLSDKAVVIDEWPEAFHSPSVEVRVPKTIALREYAPVHHAPKFCRRSIYLRDRFRCQYCGERFATEELTFDHVIPRSKGGVTTWENILTACVKCNAEKRDRDANYSGRKGRANTSEAFRPLKEPRAPTTAELLRAGLEILPPQVRETWSDYLYWEVPLLT